MQIVWSGDDAYRALFNEARSLISTTFANAARCATVDTVLLIAVNENQRFCDFELICAAPRVPIEIPDFSNAQAATELTA